MLLSFLFRTRSLAFSGSLQSSPQRHRQFFHSSMAPKQRATKRSNTTTIDVVLLSADDGNNNKKQKKSIPSYFLMKSEADVFSIDDLAARPDQTEPWDGVRNHQAKKIMQSMRIGDQAFFWSSNCKEPGIVGLVEIAQEAHPDPTQFEPSSEYYDEKSTLENPRWHCVDVKLIRKLKHPITLAELKKYSGEGGPLESMSLFKMKRLSVQTVDENEWNFVLGLEEQKQQQQ